MSYFRAKKILYPGNNVTVLETLARNLLWFTEHPGISKKSLSDLFSMQHRHVLPTPNNLPGSYEEPHLSEDQLSTDCDQLNGEQSCADHNNTDDIPTAGSYEEVLDERNHAKKILSPGNVTVLETLARYLLWFTENPGINMARNGERARAVGT